MVPSVTPQLVANTGLRALRSAIAGPERFACEPKVDGVRGLVVYRPDGAIETRNRRGGRRDWLRGDAFDQKSGTLPHGADPTFVNAVPGTAPSRCMECNETSRSGPGRAIMTALAAGSIDRLYGIASLILRDRDRAEDATQEALVHAWRDIRGLRQPESIDAWLTRLVVRACYRQRSRDRRRNVIELHVKAELEPTLGSHELSIAQRASGGHPGR